MAFTFYAPQHNGRGGHGIEKVKLRVETGVNAGRGVLMIPATVMEEARLVLGDRVVIGFEAQNICDKSGFNICIKRVAENGYKVSNSSSKAKGPKTGYVKFTAPDVLGALGERESFTAADFHCEGTSIIAFLVRDGGAA